MARKRKKRKIKKEPKQRRAVAVDAILRHAGFMRDRRKRRDSRKSWKKEIEKDLY